MSLGKNIKDLTIALCLLFSLGIINAQDAVQQRHIEVSLRMIAHQVLLSSGDSTSTILPIIKEKDLYKIQFESEFEFNPDKLVTTINKIARETNLAENYIVEVEKCETKKMIYSFEWNGAEQKNIIPCKQRNQPKSCYNLLFTLLDEKQVADTTETENQPNDESNLQMYIMAVVIGLLIILVFVFLLKRNNKPKKDPNLIPLGAYHFDKRNSELIIDEQRIELTSKEADLLFLLYNEANSTVERDVILNRVWGDEGDYVGRTLDVFISKLRKKLESDSQVKIVNIRGIGYKLVMEVK